MTTLDPRAQGLAEELLRDVGPPSAIVALRPSDGAVLAAASGPGGQGYSTATLGQYAPGSTFKVVTSLALLRSGLEQDSTVSCTPTTTVDGASFKNYDDYPATQLGEISLRAAVANSCNTALINERETAAQSDLSEAAGALGLDRDVDLGLPAFLGSVPAEATETGHAASMIGQGKLLASPLGMAAVAASVVRGDTVTPRFLADTPADPVDPDDVTQPVTADEAGQLAEMMRAVVTEGSAQFLVDVPGPAVGAKTGTAEYGTDQPPRTHAWMIGFQGDLAVAVFVEDGESGSATAGPILESLLNDG